MSLKLIFLIFGLGISTFVNSIEILDCSGKNLKSFFKETESDINIYVNVDIKKNKVIFSKSNEVTKLGETHNDPSYKSFEDTTYEYVIVKLTNNFIFIKHKDPQEGMISYDYNDKGELDRISPEKDDYMSGVIDRSKLTISIHNAKYEISKFKNIYKLNCKEVENKI